MRTKLVYDLPTRIFHWSFAFFFLSSFLIAKYVSDESVVFAYHMLSGLLLGLLVFWRIFWGFWGSEHARFSNLILHPKEIFGYGLGVLKNSKRKWLGHNPASSWSTVLMLMLASGLAISGYLMGSGYKEQVEDAHELMAEAFLIVVILHVLGIAIHTFQHRDGIGMSMLDGKKVAEDVRPSGVDKRAPAALALIALIVAGAAFLVLNFSPAQGTLKIFGSTLDLGEWDSSER